MRLYELFEDAPEGGDVVQGLRDAVLDLLTPIAASGVPKVSIQAVIDRLRSENSGLSIDRALVMHLLDPQEVAMVKKIEGDSIIFNLADEDARSESDEEAARDQAHVKATALKQAKKSVKQNPTPAAKPSPAPAPAAAPAAPAGGGGPL